MTRALALALALGPPPTVDGHQPIPTSEERAPEMLDGPTLFREGRYAEAAEAFARQYDETRDAALLFGGAMALQRAGNCWAAIDKFEAFIATSPPAADVEEAQQQIESCRRVLGVQTKKPELAPEQPQPPAPNPTPSPDESSPPPWYRDPLGSALVGVGTPVMFGGVGLYGASFAVAQGRVSGSETAYENKRTQVRAMAITGLTLLGVGAALTIVGTVRYATIRRSKARTALARANLRWIW